MNLSDLAQQRPAATQQSMSPGPGSWHVPPLGAGLIDRPRLQARVLEAPAGALVVIEAPPGYGKTSLAARCAHRVAAGGDAVAWITLDRHDDDLPRFMHHLAGALQQALGTDLAAAWHGAPQHGVASLLQTLVQASRACQLFIDETHLLHDPAVMAVLTELVDKSPASFRLVLLGCAEPPLPLARWRAQGRLVELTMQDLGFDLKETAEVVHSGIDGHLDAQSLQTLHQRTVGWPAALRLSLHSLRGAEDKADAVARLSGTSHELGGFLDLIWAGLDASLRDFMLCSALLDRLNVPLCSAVLQRDDCRAMLHRLSHEHLLLLPCDAQLPGGPNWRYHRLMGEYLRQRLQDEHPERCDPLHRRASQWLAEAGQWTAAIDHALAAGELDQAARWFQACAQERTRAGDLFTVLGWCQRFPTALARFAPEVRLAIGWAYLMRQHDAEAEAMVQALHRDVAALSAGARQAQLRCEVQALHAGVAARRDDTVQSLALALAALASAQEGPQDAWSASAACNAARFGLIWAGEFKQARALPWFGQGAVDDVRRAYPDLYRHLYASMLPQRELDLAQARQHLEEAERVARWHFGVGSLEARMCQTMLAELAYDQDQTATALSLLPSVDEIERFPLLDPMLAGYRTLMRWHGLAGDWPAVDRLADRGIACAYAQRWPRLAASLLHEHARLLLQQRRLGDAQACLDHAERLAGDAPAVRCALSVLGDHWRWLQARRLQHGSEAECRQALQQLQPLLDLADRQGDHLLWLRSAALAVEPLRRLGRLDEADALFDRLLDLAAPAEAPRLLLDLMDPAALHTALARARLRPGASRHARFTARLQALLPPPETSDTPQPLSPRELLIARLLATGLTNKQIARELAIAPETVKRHVKSIFAKLDITRRTQVTGWLAGLAEPALAGA